MKSNKLYQLYGEKINAALEMFEYKIEENSDTKLVSVYKVKETVCPTASFKKLYIFSYGMTYIITYSI